MCCTYPQASSPKAFRPNGITTDLYNSVHDPNALSPSDRSLSAPVHTPTAGRTAQPTYAVSSESTLAGTPGIALSAAAASPQSFGSAAAAYKEEDGLDFSNLGLVCPINVEDISNRWLNSYVPIPGQSAKKYPPSITAYMFRIHKSYAAVAVRGRGIPPFIHATQIRILSKIAPLSTCLSLVRICDRPLPGSAPVALEVLQREMDRLYETHQTLDDMSLLAAFQAYLIYSMVVFLWLSQGTNPFLRQAVMNLQEIACAASARGLVSLAEQQEVRPKWEAWITAEAKRRTLFTMYLFDSVLSSQDGLETYIGIELSGLLAPSSECLWKARSRREWEAAYNVHLAEWTDGGLRINELWPISPDLDEHGVAERRRRVDQWLEGVDEYGTMLFAVTSCTHGG